MSIRTNSTDVQGVLGNDYDGSTSLTPYITAASSIVDRLHTLDTAGLLSTTQLELIECWLSAHCYCLMDRLLRVKRTGKSGGEVMGVFGKGLESTPYGLNAMMLDFTGKLKSIGIAQPSMGWLGKPQSEQIAYEDRD